jgi:hypothetical protein
VGRSRAEGAHTHGANTRKTISGVRPGVGVARKAPVDELLANLEGVSRANPPEPETWTAQRIALG